MYLDDGEMEFEKLELKPLQTFMLEELRKEFAQGHRRVILQAATAAGKTIIAAKIIQNAREKGKKVLFICDRIVLVNQTSNQFYRFGISHGVIQADNPRFDMTVNCQVCSIQTLAKRGAPKSDIIIIDEAHVLYAAHKKIMDENPDAIIIGLTATPYSKGLGQYFDRIIVPVTMRRLIDEGYLVGYDVYGPKIVDLRRLKARAGEFTEESNADAFDKVDIIGDVVQEWRKHANRKKTIVFGANVAHLKHIVESFYRAGVSAVQVNAYQSEEERKEALESFTLGDTTVLASVEVATKGFDCPKAECCILAVATKKMAKLTQTVGRVLRLFPGKEKAVVLDFGGNFERLGFPEDYVMLELDTGEKERKGEKKEKEREVKLPAVCPSCDFIKPIGVKTCPACGFTPEFRKNVEVGEGTLEKIDKSRFQFSDEVKQQWLSMLNGHCQVKGKERGRTGSYKLALAVFHEKFKEWPSAVGNQVRGVVKDVSFLGVATSFLIEMPSGTVWSVYEQNMDVDPLDLRVGDEVWISWDAGHAFGVPWEES